MENLEEPSEHCPTQLNDLETRVYAAIRLAGWNGCTVDELEVQLGLTHQCASARVSELWHKRGIVEPRGARRKTRSGKLAFIYVAKKETP